MQHTKHCAFLNATVQLLACGLESTLLTALHQFNDPINSYDFTRIVASAVFSQSKAVLQSLKRLMALHCSETKSAIFPSSCYVNNSYSLEELSALQNCLVQSNGSCGRMLTSSQGVGMGNIMIRESPYICALCSSCECREENVLVEHVDMAAKLLLVGQNNIRSLNTFMENFFTALPNTSSYANNFSEILWKQSNSWSFHMQCVMILVGVLYSLYGHHESNTQIEDFNAIEKSVKTHIISKAHQFFQILVRLPLNCHAITTTVESDQSTSAIQSRRIAFAAFFLTTQQVEPILLYT
jgi:hypothetical protein